MLCESARIEPLKSLEELQFWFQQKSFGGESRCTHVLSDTHSQVKDCTANFL